MIDTARQPLPYRLSRQAGIAIQWEAAGYRLVCREAVDLSVLQEVQRRQGPPLGCEWLPTEVFDQRLGHLHAASQASTEALVEGIGEHVDLDSLMQDMPRIEDLLESENEAPVIRLINGLFAESLRLGASDIHIETFEQALLVRVRVDGVLREILRPPRALSAMLVSRIKVMARLDIAEKRQPQDGRITVRTAGRDVDIRVSTLPGIHGERVVMRILDKQANLLALDRLGMPEAVERDLRAALAQPNGIILSTGPTGSGKTTTLYASLNLLNEGSRNILTVEDPVEYAIPGIGQTPLNPRAGLTFASGLRAILRQDPDVIMIGEIRDVETAGIAVQASLTGHLVLSTLHTNSALGAITRLRDMGVEPFLLASSLKGVMAQRLVRRLCAECGTWRERRPAEIDLLPGLERLAQLRHAPGCEACNHTGYKGRLGLYEFITLDMELADRLYRGESESEMARYLESRRLSLREHALQALEAGDTSLEEVLRAVHG
ncbi:GspE/PulE family protein [Pseudomonas matsuisoli]|uniref:General secretion pathway protein E n=1 Tax=Pseudomonas matsuisoli TaxID=1515666 RepID=A0A917V0H6_9PSED|nr:ATPase, T2SS/T4P/T4SS family [Pseudomonas matsuisoli]GGK07212.1 type II secretion system protein GspE [Pseudomonas matsuisoli]